MAGLAITFCIAALTGLLLGVLMKIFTKPYIRDDLFSDAAFIEKDSKKHLQQTKIVKVRWCVFDNWGISTISDIKIKCLRIEYCRFSCSNSPPHHRSRLQDQAPPSSGPWNEDPYSWKRCCSLTFSAFFLHDAYPESLLWYRHRHSHLKASRHPWTSSRPPRNLASWLSGQGLPLLLLLHE